MTKTKKSICLFCRKPFETHAMCQVFCSVQCRLKAHIVEEPNGCWIWNGSVDKDGYGLISVSDKSYRAHRVAYEAFKNEKIEPYKLIGHKCDNTLCINPDHLFICTPKENTRDMLNKGRGGPGRKYAVLDEERVKQILILRKSGISTYRIAKVFNISFQLADRVIKRKIWKHVQIE